MDIQIIVVAHKPYPMICDDMYKPLLVGADKNKFDGFEHMDNTGDNISIRNPYFCELTGLYWAWKNMDCDYLGLCHYRRYFANPAHLFSKRERLDQAHAQALLEKHDAILPKKRHYFIETVYSHYSHTHYGDDLDATRNIIAKRYPDYLPSFDKHMKSRSGHICNMFVMKKELADTYCQFLFDVLFELETVTDISEYDAFQARMYGRIAELLMDVFMDHHQIDYAEVPFLYSERVRWFKKGSSFLKAKLFHKKYTESF
jgi:hypothetical protein